MIEYLYKQDGRVKPFFESSRESSQIIFSIISFSVYFDKNINKFFMTHYLVPSFYITKKNKNSPTKDKMTQLL